MGANHDNLQRSLQGIDRLTWGAHACQMYESTDDMFAALVPYFSAGLRNNEACVWITSDQRSIAEARRLMGAASKEFAGCFASGQMEIREAREWYLRDGAFDADAVLDAWIEREQRALREGYSGLRLTGDTSWIDGALWDGFMDYERKVDQAFPKYRMISLCTYCRHERCAEQLAAVARHHQFAVSARDFASPLTLGDVLYADGRRPRVTEAEWVALVRAAGGGDQRGLHALYDRAHRPVFTLAVRITGSREAAEEVTLDVFHDVWRGATRYDPANGTVLGWIMNQARARAIAMGTHGR